MVVSGVASANRQVNPDCTVAPFDNHLVHFSQLLMNHPKFQCLFTPTDRHRSVVENLTR